MYIKIQAKHEPRMKFLIYINHIDNHTYIYKLYKIICLII